MDADKIAVAVDRLICARIHEAALRRQGLAWGDARDEAQQARDELRDALADAFGTQDGEVKP
ncbi:hypothetical protein [Ramlibacter sp.]|uniref:hypothetical protein n=1 Tax=Ramlibacter sp. TaxID=1917967 RepID=UPI003D0B1E3D